MYPAYASLGTSVLRTGYVLGGVQAKQKCRVPGLDIVKNSNTATIVNQTQGPSVQGPPVWEADPIFSTWSGGIIPISGGTVRQVDENGLGF